MGEIYSETDGMVGYWVTSRPYEQIGSSEYDENGRNYLVASKIGDSMRTGCVDTKWVGRYFGNIGKKGKSSAQFYLEGRRFYPTSGWAKTIRVGSNATIEIPDYNVAVSACMELAPFNGAVINMSHLICAQLSGTSRGLGELFKNLSDCGPTSSCYECTDIGTRISSSLITIAASRIFADPEQSILELPVNSLDSYNPEMRVGKFGMGFFSFLYWLIGHPKRKLHIYSWFRNDNNAVCGYTTTIADSDTGLTMTLRILETSVIQTGTLVHMDTSDDQFTDANLTEFESQLKKLKYTSGVRLYTAKQTDGIPATSSFGDPSNEGKPTDPAVFVGYGRECIFVEDYAGGIPIQVLLGSLFVPSVSTKTIKDAVKVPKGWKSKTKRLTALSKAKKNNLASVITVANVVVVSLKSTGFDNWAFRLDMPPNTRLPVSRDDIIIDSVTGPIFERELTKLFGLAVKSTKFAVVSLQNTILEYISKTSTANQVVCRKVMSEFTSANAYRLVDRNMGGIQTVYPSAIVSVTSDMASVELALDALDYDATIWNGKKVVIVEKESRVTTYGTISFVFVPKSFAVGSNWSTNVALANPRLSLCPIATSYGDEKYKKYENFIPTSIRKDRHLSAIFVTAIATFEGLQSRFKMSKYTTINFAGEVAKKYVSSYPNSVWPTLIYKLIDKLASFKGNATYGGSKYEMNIPVYAREVTDMTDKKLIRFCLDAEILTIASFTEMQSTVLQFSHRLWPGKYVKNLPVGLRPPKITSLRLNTDMMDGIFMYSNTITEYSVLIAAVCIRGVSTFAPKLAIDLPTRAATFAFMRLMCDRVREMQFDRSRIESLYRIILNFAMPTFIKPIHDTIASWWHLATRTKVATFREIESGKKHVDFTTSQLIGHLFVSNPTLQTRKGADDAQRLMNVFGAASKYKGDARLQIAEIAINEGTTKDFVSASLTELVQNSVDAIRTSSAKNKQIDVQFGSTDGVFEMAVIDHVGMPPTAFLTVGIPFLSTKSASPLVTGEMGSGFFNVYRGSDMVSIDTIHEGVRYVSIDTPIYDAKSGRVVDINRRVSIEKVAKKTPNRTEIRVRTKKLDIGDATEYMGTARYTVSNILALVTAFDSIKMTLNGEFVGLKSPLVHACSYGYFDLYFLDRKEYEFPSYIMTKGIPFAPLENYYNPLDLKQAVASHIIINIRHGGFTPIQSRTRINMPPESLVKFERLLAYTQFLHSAAALVLTTAQRMKWVYPNIDSRATADQMHFTEYILEPRDGISEYHYFMFTDVRLGTKTPSAKYTIAGLTNTCIPVFMKATDATWENDVSSKLDELVNTSQPVSDSIVKDTILKWFEFKTRGDPTGESPVPKTPKGSEKKQPTGDDVIDEGLTRYINAWISTYIEIGTKAGVLGMHKGMVAKAEALHSEKMKGASGWFQPSNKSIGINTYSMSRDNYDSLYAILQSLKKPEDIIGSVDTPFETLFGYSFPSATLPHEMEHARRKTAHSNSAGSHDMATSALWDGDIARQRSYDECANDVYSRIISDGFYQKFLAKVLVINKDYRGAA